MRHDWTWPATRPAFANAVLDSVSGWRSSGLGEPNPRPTTYLFAPLLLVSNFVAGPRAALAALFALSSLFLYLTSECLARRCRVGKLATLAIFGFLLFNPWVYVQVVAGHAAMILAYASFAYFFCLLHDSGARDRTVFVALAGTLCQLQFFLIAFPLAAIWAVRRRRYIPVVTIALAATPIALGIVADRGYLTSIPFYLDWQEQQSVPIVDALRLTGYFAHYDAQILPVAGPATCVFAAVAILSAFIGGSRSRLTAAFAAVLILLASGSSGPLSTAYRYVLSNFPPVVGVYRELYDVLGLVVVAYAALAAESVSRIRFMPHFLLAAAGALLFSWIIAPPHMYWLDGETLPSIKLPVDENHRLALFPPFQPQKYHGHGSGADPDENTFVAQPILNDYLAIYPIDVAFSMYDKRHDTGFLEALAVNRLVFRPWLSGDESALRSQDNVAPSKAPLRAGVEMLTSSQAILSLGDPSPATAIPEVGAHAIYVGDARDSGTSSIFESFPLLAHQGRDLRSGWINARRAATQLPEFSSPLDGIVTESNKPLFFPETHTRYILAHWQGTLILDGQRFRVDKITQRWLPIRSRSLHALTCGGVCELNDTAIRDPYRQTSHVKSRERSRSSPLQLHYLLPWLATSAAPAGSPGIITLIVRYDPGWYAFCGTGVMPHLRLDGLLNGWIVPQRDSNRPLLFVHVTSAAQAILEGLTFAVVLILVLRTIRRKRINGSAPNANLETEL